MKYKKYLDEGYAFFTTSNDDKEITHEEINIHFNEWYSPRKCYLDIGVRVCKIDNARYLYIYLPYKLGNKNNELKKVGRKSKKEYNTNNNDGGFEDLFNRFDEKWVVSQLGKSKFDSEQTVIFEEAKEIAKNTARAIFNSGCKITCETDLKTDEALREDLQNIIRIEHGRRMDYIIKADGILKPVDIKCNGTLLKVDCEKYKQIIISDKNNEFEKGLYVRFRVSHPQLEIKQLKNGGVTSGTLLDAPSSNTLIQYMQRVNDVRSLPHEILEKFHDIGKQYIGKVMSMIAVNRKYEIDDGACYKIRQLEYNLHKKYIPDGFIEYEKRYRKYLSVERR